MKKKDEIRRMWKESFNESAEWTDMFFDTVYDDDDAMTLEINGATVSSLMLQRYIMNFHNTPASMGYIAGACTRRAARGKGYMSRLVVEALNEAARRGDMLVSLIPAEGHLYYYYERFGFSTVFYVDLERYSSMHSFGLSPHYHEAKDIDTDTMFGAFNDMELECEGRVVHTRRQFESVLADTHLDGGSAVVIASDDGAIAAIAFAVPTDDTLVITDILWENREAREAALASLRSKYRDKAFVVKAPATDLERRRLTPRGMARIVNVDLALQAIAAAHPSYRARIRVSDPLLRWNSGIYRLGGGESIKMPDDAFNHGQKIDFDVSIDDLSRIIFSGKRAGGMINFPTLRPHISLMLD